MCNIYIQAIIIIIIIIIKQNTPRGAGAKGAAAPFALAMHGRTGAEGTLWSCTKVPLKEG